MRHNKLHWRKTAQKKPGRSRVFMDLYAPEYGRIIYTECIKKPDPAKSSWVSVRRAWVFRDFFGDLSPLKVRLRASGFWPTPIFVGASWVRRMGKRLPPGDPIHLRVEAGRLYLNRYSEACSLTAAAHVVSNELSEADEAQLIDEAARILKSLRISPEALQELVSKTYVNGPISPSVEEKKMLSLIAKAWILLAPFGVGTNDLRQLVDNAVRNAWK